jgi:2-polyprenyl-3-methyl-5-hydroxy-6-metoxy-1,4-benzoquinol methylase
MQQFPRITPKTKIAIGLPRGKCGFEWEWIQCLLNMMSANPAQYTTISKSAPHASARNNIAKRFLDSEAEYLLWIDSDTLWKPQDIALLMETLDNGADVATGIQFSCSEHNMPLIRYIDAKKGVTYPVIDIPTDGKPFEIGACGFGFVLMKREVVEKVKHPRFEFKSGFSEDIYFCLMALQQGFKIMADPRVMVGHINQKVYTVDDYLAKPRSMRQAYIKEAIESSVNYMQNTFPDWKEVMGFNSLRKPEEAVYSISDENINTPEYWDKVYKDEVESGYLWRTYPDKFEFITKNLVSKLPEGAKILELGAGLGVLAKKILDEYGDKYELEAGDASGYAVQYMNDRDIDAYRVEVPGDLQDWNKEDYDCIMAFELLEHLDERARWETVDYISRMLKDGGVAILTVPNDILPPSQVQEHRVCYNKDTFKEFLNDTFNGRVEVHSHKTRVSDVERSDGKEWAWVEHLFGICIKGEE